MRVLGKANIVKSKGEASHIKKFFELIATKKYTIREARKIVLSDGLELRNGKKPSEQYFYNRIIKNKIYCGIIEKMDLSIKGDFEPIISEELFNKAREIINRKGKRKYTKSNPDFPLRGFAFDNAGNRFTASWSRGRKEKYPYYYNPKTKINVKKSDFELKFKDFLNSLNFNYKFSELLKIAIEINWQEIIKNKEKNKKEMEKSLAKLKEEQKNVVEGIANKTIPSNIGKEYLEGSINKTGAIEEDLRAFESEDTEGLSLVLSNSLGFLEDLGSGWEGMGYSTKQQLNWFFFPDGVIFENGNFRTTKMAFIINKKETLQVVNSPMAAPGGIEPPFTP